jgi:pentatricopeptide repeat protein
MFNSFFKQSYLFFRHQTIFYSKSVSYDKQLLNANKNIHRYVLLGRLSDALEELNKMEKNKIKPDLYTYTELLNGYVESEKYEEAYKIIEEMKSKEIKPNVFTYTTLIKGLCKSGDIDTIPELFTRMRQEGIEPNSVT